MDTATEELTFRFEPSAYLQRLLGRELISTDALAIAELVKNSYDAGARTVEVEYVHAGVPTLIVRDDGSGMSEDEFERLWMVPGFSEKPQSKKASGRTLTGEKGIGRFAADKIAKRLTLVTKTVGDKIALRVEFDWDEFNDRSLRMRDVEIKGQRVADAALTEFRFGTRLELSALRSEWNGTSWNHLQRELQNLVTPYRDVRGFRIVVTSEKWGSGVLGSAFERYPGYQYEFDLKKDGRLSLTFARPRSVAEKIHKSSKLTRRRREFSPEFGPVKGKFFYLRATGPLRALGFDPGVRVYRDGFRVEPYGRPDDDWLDLKSWKASRHGHVPINPKLLFGFVDIRRHENSALRDVTNREGLIETGEFAAFRNFVREHSRAFAEFIGQDKSLLKEDDPAREAQKEAQAREVRKRQFSRIAGQLAHQLRQPLGVIGYESGNIVAHLKQQGKHDEYVSTCAALIASQIRSIDEQIGLMERRAAASKVPASDLDICAWLFEGKLPSYRKLGTGDGIHLSGHCEGEMTITFSPAVLGFVVDTLVNNAIQACNRRGDGEGAVHIRIEKSPSRLISVSVEDDGPGVPEEVVDRLFHEHVPSQSGGTGFGLVHSHELIQEFGGQLRYEKADNGNTRFVMEFREEDQHG